LSGELVRKALDTSPAKALIRFSGSAGQSFGAFLVASLVFELEGEANDFVGKGLSGGTISIRPPADRRFEAQANVIAGNVCLFGATAGELYLNGRVGERFAVRNSGAIAVVEGVGDHACEYMTGGRVTILGRTGGNFGAGMSGGLAFVLDEDGSFAGRVAAGSVLASPAESLEDVALLRGDLERHVMKTDSSKAAHVLEDWPKHAAKFIVVKPMGMA
jgi:glutamate synthase domain-containing protein 3